MKNSLKIGAAIFTMLLTTTVISAQTTTEVINLEFSFSKEDVVETTIGYETYRYATINSPTIQGTYAQKMENSRNTTEAVIILKDKGICTTEWFNSGYVGKPKRSTTPGTWGILLDKNDIPITSNFEGGKWYKIVLISSTENDLEYYDKKAWHDWVGIYPNGDAFLKLAHSTGEKVKKK